MRSFLRGKTKGPAASQASSLYSSSDRKSLDVVPTATARGARRVSNSGGPGSERIEYNDFIKSTFKTGEISDIVEAVRQLVLLAQQGDRGSKTLLLGVIPRLAQAGLLPAAALAQLQLALTSINRDKHPKACRAVYYLCQLTLSCGAGGTPLPFKNLATESHTLQLSNIPPDALRGIWQYAGDADKDEHLQKLSLRCLAAAARGVHAADPKGAESGLGKKLGELVQIYMSLDSSTSLVKRGLFRGRKEVSAEAIIRAAVAAARVGLHRRALDRAAVKALPLTCALDPLAARHAMALASSSVDVQGPKIREFFHSMLQITLKSASYVHKGQLYEPPKPPSAGKLGKDGPGGADAGEAGGLNLQDPFTRVHLARVCGRMLVLSPIGGKLKSSKQGAVFWKVLVALMSSDNVAFVVFEAIRCLFGSSRARPARLGNKDADMMKLDLKFEEQLGRERAAGWHMCLSMAQSQVHGYSRPTASAAPAGGEARAWTLRKPDAAAAAADAAAQQPTSPVSPPAPGTPGVRPGAAAKSTLFPVILGRLKVAMTKGSAEKIAACGCIAAMGEARAHALRLSPKPETLGPPEVQRAMEHAASLAANLLNAGVPATVRCAAVEALLWLQVPGKPPLLPPQELLQVLMRGGAFPGVPAAAPSPWPASHIMRIEKLCLRRLLANPLLAPWALACCGAAALSQPTAVDPAALCMVWDQVAGLGPAGAADAVQAAVDMVNSSLPPACRPSSKSAARQVIAAAVEHAAWQRLKSAALWWLGESANATAREALWMPPIPALLEPQPAETCMGQGLALEATRSPILMSVIAQLHRAMLVEAWPLRVLAAKALGKVAVRSCEPYRIQAYSILASVLQPGAGGAFEKDVLGLSGTVKPMLGVLDRIYASQVVLDRLVQVHTTDPKSWPEGQLQQVAAQHKQLLDLIHAHIGWVPPTAFYPLGIASAPLLGAEPPQPGAGAAAAAAAFHATRSPFSPTAGDWDVSPDASFFRERRALAEQPEAVPEEEADDIPPRATAQPPHQAPAAAQDYRGPEAAAALQQEPAEPRASAAGFAVPVRLHRAGSSSSSSSSSSDDGELQVPAAVEEEEIPSQEDAAYDPYAPPAQLEDDYYPEEDEDDVSYYGGQGRFAQPARSSFSATASRQASLDTSTAGTEEYNPYAPPAAAAGYSDPYAPGTSYDPYDQSGYSDNPYDDHGGYGGAASETASQASGDPYAPRRTLSNVSYEQVTADNPYAPPQDSYYQDADDYAEASYGGFAQVHNDFGGGYTTGADERRSLDYNDARYSSAWASVDAAFDGENEEELTVEPGDQLEVLGRDPGGWYFCRHEDGREGLVPMWTVPLPDDGASIPYLAE